MLWVSIGLMTSLVGADTEPPSATVLRLNARHGVSQELADLLSERITDRVRDSRVFERVIGISELDALMDLEKQKALMACDTDSCMAEIAGALGVRYVVMGSLGRLGDTWLINLSLADTQAATVLSSVSQSVQGRDEGALAPAIDPLVLKLLEPLGPASQTAAAEPVAHERSSALAWALLAGGGFGASMAGAVLVMAVVSGAVGTGLFAVANGTDAFVNRGLGLPLTAAMLGSWSVLGAGVPIAMVMFAISAALIAGFVAVR